MKRIFSSIFLLLLLWITTLEAVAQKKAFIPADHPYIAYTGRISFSNPESPRFVYPGVQIRAIFEGTSLGIHMKPNSGYFMISLDDLPPFKVFFSKNDSILTLKENLPEGRHEVKILLAYEAYNQRPEFRGFILDEGKNLPVAPKLPKRRMEFIGNSITCGYGVEAPDEKARFSNETENHYYSYAAMTARAFDAQSMVVARSGIGIYRNYAGPKEGNRNNMPAVYANTLFNDPSETWDFTAYKPHVLCVNLGTNDTSTEPYDIDLLENAYRNFLKTLRSHYPKTKIIFITGSMLSGKSLQDVQQVLNRVTEEARKAGDKRVYRFDFTPANGSLGYGADFHPSIAQNEANTKELIPFIRKITGWKAVNANLR